MNFNFLLSCFQRRCFSISFEMKPNTVSITIMLWEGMGGIELQWHKKDIEVLLSHSEKKTLNSKILIKTFVFLLLRAFLYTKYVYVFSGI